MNLKNPKRTNLVFLAGLLSILTLAGHRVSFSATPDEVEAYLTRKNANPNPIKWQFTNQDARIKLHSVYPSV